MSAKRRARALAAVLAMLGLPVAVAAVEAATFYVRNRNNGRLVSSGQQREYLLHVPQRYDRNKPTPLVISLHGAGMWPVAQMETSRWNELADSEGFLVVYPSGIAAGGPRVWHEEAGAGSSPDVRFIAELIDALSAEYNVDPDRIYANGLSNGGGMSFALSCTLPDRIAAVGLVGAAHLTPWSWCEDRRPVPMISFHGTADRFAPYGGGTSFVAPRPFPDIPSWTAHWAHRNQCDMKPVEAVVAADVIRLEYANCADDAPVQLYTIKDGGHTWPGGEPLPEWFAGPTSYSIDATRLMWEFFREHPLRRTRAAARGN